MPPVVRVRVRLPKAQGQCSHRQILAALKKCTPSPYLILQPTGPISSEQRCIGSLVGWNCRFAIFHHKRHHAVHLNNVAYGSGIAVGRIEPFHIASRRAAQIQSALARAVSWTH